MNIIETDRLILRELITDDYDDLCNILQMKRLCMPMSMLFLTMKL